MSGGALLPRYSRQEWGVRLVLAGVAGWMGYLSVTHSLAIALPNSQIERAHALAPGDGQIGGRLSEVLSGPAADDAGRDRAAEVARAALRNDPTAVEAVATLGLDATIRGDKAAARELFTYSQQLSRRDFRTQLWAIEYAVAQGDIAGALRHYDIALRTKGSAPELLYPVLVGAAANADVRPELIRTLAKKPIWAESFLYYAASNGPEPRDTAALFQELQKANVAVPKVASSRVVNSLLKAENFAEAWSYYSAIRGVKDPSTSRDPDFNAMFETPMAFDWVAKNAVGISTVIQPGDKTGLFDFAVSSSIGGVLLEQQQMLPEGEYVLHGRSIGIDLPARSRPYWSLSCHGGDELGRMEVPNSSEFDGLFTGHFTVPANCPLQVLTLVARSSSEVGGVSGQIDRAELRPASRTVSEPVS